MPHLWHALSRALGRAEHWTGRAFAESLCAQIGFGILYAALRVTSWRCVKCPANFFFELNTLHRAVPTGMA